MSAKSSIGARYTSSRQVRLGTTRTAILNDRLRQEGFRPFMIDAIVEIIVFAVVIATAYGLVYWAHRAYKADRSAYVGLFLVFGLPGGLLTVAGAALLVNGADGGWLALGLGVGLGLPLIKQFRMALARATPMDSASPIDFSGLAILLAIAAYLVYTLIFVPPADADASDTVMSSGATITSLIINVAAFVALAYVAVGYRIHRTGQEATNRLGLEWPNARTVTVGVLAIVPAFVFSIAGSLLTQIFQPEVVDRLEETIDTMTSGIQNPIGALILGLSTGIGEEVLFRGAIQPRYGIVIASAIWSLLHVQYELTWVVAGLFAMGIMLGLIRKHYGTTAAIITHALYNVVIVLIQTTI
jgi:membrane protease YdiL (CAAX protease family)